MAMFILAQSVFKTVAARYKTVKEQLYAKPYTCVCDGKAYTHNRTLLWLWKPISFARPQIDLVRGRDYSFVDGGKKVSLNTLVGRIICPYKCGDPRLFSPGWKQGTAKLVLHQDGRWYLYVSLTCECEVPEREDVKTVIGADRGLRFLINTSDSNNKNKFYSGREAAETRHKYSVRRAELQAKGTKSAKRKLKQLSGKENSWMSNQNHCLSKALTEEYAYRDALFVLEDLTGVSFSAENLHGHEQSMQLRSWTFYALEQQLKYKGALRGISVINVPAKYTSQRCPKCGNIDKLARDHGKHEYHCRKCGFQTNDDRVGSLNLAYLGGRYLKGEDNPSITKSTTADRK